MSAEEKEEYLLRRQSTGGRSWLIGLCLRKQLARKQEKAVCVLCVFFFLVVFGDELIQVVHRQSCGRGERSCAATAATGERREQRELGSGQTRWLCIYRLRRSEQRRQGHRETQRYVLLTLLHLVVTAFCCTAIAFT